MNKPLHQALLAAGMVVSLLSGPQVSAQELMDAKKPQAILEIAKGFGSAKLGTDAEGDPLITGRIKGTKYGIYFYGCNSKGEECDDIQFNAAWSGVKASLEDVNRWNAEKRYGKAYIDSEGDPVIQTGLATATSMTPSTGGARRWRDLSKRWSIKNRKREGLRNRLR